MNTQFKIKIRLKKETEFGHLMVDIETMGNTSNSAILSIGAVEFDIETGETGRAFMTPASLKSSLELGLTVDADTIMWWLKQSEEARMILNMSDDMRFTISSALIGFSEFCTKDYQIWGNSARFDLGILQDAYNKLKMDIPWDFRKERDVRTLVSFNEEIKKNTVFEGVAHSPVDDCRHQIKYCSEIWNSLNK